MHGIYLSSVVSHSLSGADDAVTCRTVTCYDSACGNGACSSTAGRARVHRDHSEGRGARGGICVYTARAQAIITGDSTRLMVAAEFRLRSKVGAAAA